MLPEDLESLLNTSEERPRLRAPRNESFDEISQVSTGRFAAVACNETPLRADARLGYVPSCRPLRRRDEARPYRFRRFELPLLYTIAAAHVYTCQRLGIIKSVYTAMNTMPGLGERR